MNMDPIGTEIQSLIIAQITGNISDEENAHLNKVLSENAGVRQLYEDIRTVLESPEGIKAKNELDSHVNVDDLMVDRSPARTRRKRLVSISIAAMLIVILGVYMASWPSKSSTTSQLAIGQGSAVELQLEDGEVVTLEKNDTALTTDNISLNSKNNTLTYSALSKVNSGNGIIKVPVGRLYNLVLSDGSIIMLNSDTKLSFPFSFTGKYREIWVDGEAYIDVKHVAEKPFVVHLPTGNVTVLGTSFNVNTYDNQTKVSLVNGKVKYATSKDSVTLVPGKEIIGSLSKPLLVQSFEKDEVVGWINGIYIYHDDTLEEIAKVLERWYGVKIILSDDSRAKRFYGVIQRNKPINSFLDVLILTNELDLKISNDTVYIK